MRDHSDLVEDLTTLNQIAETLNRAVDMRGALDSTLARLVQLMGLEAGLIFLKNPTGEAGGEGDGYTLAAHYNLPPVLALDNRDAWAGTCECQRLASSDRLSRAHNVVGCSRLAGVTVDRRGLAVHASAALRSSDRVLGILNVIGRDGTSFDPRALALLTNVGSQMGIALERARLFDLLKEQRMNEGRVLLDLSNKLLRNLDLGSVVSHLVEEAGRLLRVDACALLLPGEQPDTMLFRAASGWKLDPAARERQLSTDECSGLELVMRTQQPLLMEDVEASEHAAWGTDWLRSEGFRGHAVIPLVVDGRSIGVLMIDTRQPRVLNEDEVRFLALLANQAATAIENARLHGQEIVRHRMERELEVGRQIQLGLLPKEVPIMPGWEFAAVYQAARQVGGDFYDFFELPGEPKRFGLVTADVADKGVPAALMMAMSRTVVRAAANDGRCPSDALTLANRLILQDSQTDLFVTVLYATLDTHSGWLTYANAGHNWPMWYQARSHLVQGLPSKGIALGVLDEIELENQSVELTHGDLVVFYTDGVTEAMDTDGQPFGQERLKEAVLANSEASAQQVLSAIVEAVGAFTGDAPQSDDLTIFVVKRCQILT